MEQQHTADAAVAVTWSAWIISHISQINEVLQFFLLLLGLVSAVYAALWHRKRWRRK